MTETLSSEDLRKLVFTVCSVNYIGKAMALLQSVLDHNTDTDVAIVLVDSKRKITCTDNRVKLIWAEDIDFPNYFQCAFKYNIFEFNTSIKPFVSLYFLKEYQKLIYLDPDICTYSTLEPVFSALDHCSTILSPHATSPYPDKLRPSDQDLLRFGSFNLGFYAVKHSEHSVALLSWWHKKCQNDCFYDPSTGLGVDQKWMDLAPSFFDDIMIIKHPGINLAFWNLHERTISRSKGDWLVNDEHPLIFLHFSSFDDTDHLAVAGKQTRYPSGARPDFSEARVVYQFYLEMAKNQIIVDDSEYGYALMSGGQSISFALRRFYALKIADDFSQITDPFAVPGEVHAFAKRNRLYSKHGPNVTHLNFKQADKHRSKAIVLRLVFKAMLKILGPDRYFLLMRYFSHYSSLLNQSDLM